MRNFALAYGMQHRRKMAKGGVASPTGTTTETGGSSPGGASTGGVGSGLGGAGTGGAATGGASTGGAGTVTVSISGSSSTETSSGAGAKKGSGKGGKPAGPITLNISNVGGTTDAGNVASGDGPGASGSGGTAPNGFGGGGGGAAPGEPEDISASNKYAHGGVVGADADGEPMGVHPGYGSRAGQGDRAKNGRVSTTEGKNKRRARDPLYDSAGYQGIADGERKRYMMAEDDTPHNKSMFKKIKMKRRGF